MKPEVKLEVTFTEGYKERFTAAILDEIKNREREKDAEKEAG